MAFTGRAAWALLACLAAVGSARAAPAEVPDGLKLCPQDDNLDACIKDAVSAAFPVVADGLPTLSIPPIDPLDIKNLVIGQGSGPVKINLEFYDCQLLGLKDAYMESIHADLENFKITGRVKFNGPIRIRGPYKIQGSVLLLPINGDGQTNITLNNLIADIDIRGERITKNGLEYIKVDTFGLMLTVSHLQMHFTNLFNGDKALGDTMNNFLNENWSEIYRELNPAFEQTLGAIFLQITARFFQKVPFDKVFLK
ncbi:Protein takeout [Gryllus bimaculatus]|nr:Protein takeout [Gryllus bimaculatus]